ncbi:MAG: hypothetical protein V2I43_00820 [Parvularcula sp.]|nr:hypothetical protein [Parvularcula sp.]
MNKNRYSVPAALEIEHSTYLRWLRRKAGAHLKRDRKRFPERDLTGESYRLQIHEAVCHHGTQDFYTGEALDWSLVSTYDNAASKAGRTAYKLGFALLPTVDHVFAPDGSWRFVICAWRTNDAKNDMSHADFVALCQRVVDHHKQNLSPRT